MRIDEREVFDDLMDLYRSRSSVGGAAVRCNVVESLLMTLVFIHHKMILELKKMSSTVSKFHETYFEI